MKITKILRNLIYFVIIICYFCSQGCKISTSNPEIKRINSFVQYSKKYPFADVARDIESILDETKNKKVEIIALKTLIELYYFHGELDEQSCCYKEKNMFSRLNKLRRYNEAPFVNFMYGIYYFTKGNNEKAIKYFENVNKLSVSSDLLYLQILSNAFSDFIKGNLDQAEQSAFKAEKKNKTYWTSFLLGMIYQKKGLLDKAIDYYKTAIKKEPRLSYAYFYISKIYWQKNLKKEALDYIDEAYDINIYNDEIKSTRDNFHDIYTLELVSNYKPTVSAKIPPVKIEFEIQKFIGSVGIKAKKEKIPIIPPWMIIKRIKNLSAIRRELKEIVEKVYTKFLTRCPYLLPPTSCALNELELNYKYGVCKYKFFLVTDYGINFCLVRYQPASEFTPLEYKDIPIAVVKSLFPFAGTVPNYLERKDSPLSGCYYGIVDEIADAYLYLLGYRKEIKEVKFEFEDFIYDFAQKNKQVMMIVLFYLAGEQTFMLSLEYDTLSPIREKFDTIFGRGSFDYIRKYILIDELGNEANFSVKRFAEILNKHTKKNEILKGINDTAKMFGYRIDKKFFNISSYKSLPGKFVEVKDYN